IFVIALLSPCGDPGACHSERYRSVSVGARPDWGTVIGRDENAPAAIALKRSHERPDNVPIDLLQSQDLRIDSPLVRCFIRSLDMHTYEVALFQGFDARAAFGGVVRVEVAGRPGDIDPLPA